MLYRKWQKTLYFLILFEYKRHYMAHIELWKQRFLMQMQENTKRCRLSLLTNSAPHIRVQMRGRVGVAGSQPMSTAVHITGHRAQINFGDLPPYWTYVQMDPNTTKGPSALLSFWGRADPKENRDKMAQAILFKLFRIIYWMLFCLQLAVGVLAADPGVPQDLQPGPVPRDPRAGLPPPCPGAALPLSPAPPAPLAAIQPLLLPLQPGALPGPL
jgi:hypothetical protein